MPSKFGRLFVVGKVPWLVYSIGRLSNGGRKVMNLRVFGIATVGCYGDVVVDGKLGRLDHIFWEIPYQV